jgi:Rieske Fe-S protein
MTDSMPNDNSPHGIPPSASPPPGCQAPDMKRRAVVGAIMGAGIGVGALALRGIRDGVSPRPTVSQRAPEPATIEVVPAAALGDLKEMPRRIEVRIAAQDGWKLREETVTVFAAKQGSAYVVLSSTCPHSGCTVSLDPKDKAAPFSCPCHHAKFGPDGAVLGGPAPRPLDRLECHVADETGALSARFARFKLNVADKKELA